MKDSMSVKSIQNASSRNFNGLNIKDLEVARIGAVGDLPQKIVKAHRYP
jgi:hypothetical protein